jgi:acetyl esterase/lipase
MQIDEQEPARTRGPAHKPCSRDHRSILSGVRAFAALLIAALLAPAVARAQQLYLDPQFDVQRTNGIVYGTAPIAAGSFDLLLDLYEPTGVDVPMQRPVFVTIHGGGFASGSRSDRHVEIATEMARRGYTAVSIDYRLEGQAPVVSSPFQPIGNAAAAVEDLVQAHAWLLANAAALDIDPSRIVLGGSSAGAITAAHAAYDLDDLGITPLSGVRSVVDLWGAIQGPADVLEASEAPIMIVHGTEDQAVPFSSGQFLANRAATVGVPFKFDPIVGAGHGFAAIPIFETQLPSGETIFERIVQFVFTHISSDRARVTQNRDQRRCTIEVHKRSAAIAKEQGKVSVSCVQHWARQKLERIALDGQDASPQACLTNDVRKRVGKRIAQLAGKELDRCTDPLPEFAYATGAASGSAARDSALALIADILGPDLDLTVVVADPDLGGDPKGSRCQIEAMKRTQRVYDNLWRFALKAKKKALDGKDRLTGGDLEAPVGSTLELQAEVLAFLATNKRAVIAAGRDEARLRVRVQNRCNAAADPPTTPMADLLPGKCGGAADWDTLSTCLIERARCRFCEASHAVDGASLNCDGFDNGVVDLSCH